MPKSHEILIIGSTGQLGRDLLAAKWPAGVAPRAIGRAQCDLASTDSIQVAFGALKPAMVINVAAYTNVEQAESDGGTAQRVNCDGPTQLAKIGGERRIPMIHISSDYVFNGAARRPYREDDALSPLNRYGESKADADRRIPHETDCCTILRTSWLFSPYSGNFVSKIFAAANRDSELRVVDDQTGSPTYSGALAQAIIAVIPRCLDHDPDAFGLFNLAGADEATWYDLAQAALANSPVPAHRNRRITRISTAEYPTRAVRPKYSVLDNSLAASKLGLIATPWRDALRACLSRIELC